MPLSINVGLSRKASKNYQSTGVSINVTAELHPALLAMPSELQAQIDGLYSQAAEAMERQVQAYAARARAPVTFNGSGYSGHINATKSAGMTKYQRQAIDSIGHRLHLDVQRKACELFGIGVECLSIRQASEMIDHLKGLPIPSRNGSGR